VKRSKVSFIGIGLAVGVLVATASAAALSEGAQGPRGRAAALVSGTTFRWDISTVGGGVVRAGGTATALARNGAKIALTGSGTFGGPPKKVTGGGNWTTFDPSGGTTGSGTYQVKALVSFYLIAGTLPSTLTDEIASAANARAGFATLRVKYSNGTAGIITVSCRLAGTPPGPFEGITASMGGLYYSGTVDLPASSSDPNRTVFHVGA